MRSPWQDARVQRGAVGAYLLCALIWGTTWYAIRVCIHGYPTLDAVAIRFVIAALVLLPVAWRARPWPARRAWMWLVLAGILDAAGYGLVYYGEEQISGGLAAVLYGTQPLVLALLLTATRMERISQRHVVGALVSLGGVAVIFLDRLHVSAHQAVGVALVVVSVITATIYSMIMKRHAGKTHGAVVTWIFLAVTGASLGIAALVVHQPIPWPPPAAPTFALLYLALVGSVVAFLAYFWLLSHTTLLVTSTLVFVFPIVALLTDAIAEDASLTGRAYAGAAITLAGLALSLRRA
jgi:drug/metabolite transporter (DMT)-like permease